MAGIYIHIPFCKQACHYCDFHFSTTLKYKEQFLSALLREIELQKNFFIKNENVVENEEINTIYFGGGTPSILSQTELMRVVDAISQHFIINKNAEITLEANPDDLTVKKIKELRTTPINRFSIGIQSFFDEDLKLLNRVHNTQDAITAVKASQDAGFENITIDLIYGIQTLSNARWKENLRQAFELEVKHISSYCLTVEEKTALSHFVKSGKIKNVDEQQCADQFEIMLEQMEKNGFVQYEISNFCKDHAFSVHNSNYWLKKPYLGLGPSAHSFDGRNRQWNISNNALYIQSLEKGELNFEREFLTQDQQYNEYILTSLRTMWGTDLTYLKTKFGRDYMNYCLKEAEEFILTNDVLHKEEKLFLTNKGKLFADKIASHLFRVES